MNNIAKIDVLTDKEIRILDDKVFAAAQIENLQKKRKRYSGIVVFFIIGLFISVFLTGIAEWLFFPALSFFFLLSTMKFVSNSNYNSKQKEQIEQLTLKYQILPTTSAEKTEWIKKRLQVLKNLTIMSNFTVYFDLSQSNKEPNVYKKLSFAGGKTVVYFLTDNWMYITAKLKDRIFSKMNCQLHVIEKSRLKMVYSAHYKERIRVNIKYTPEDSIHFNPEEFAGSYDKYIPENSMFTVQKVVAKPGNIFLFLENPTPSNEEEFANIMKFINVIAEHIAGITN